MSKDTMLVYTLDGTCSDIESWARLKASMIDYVAFDEGVVYSDYTTQVDYMEDGSFAFQIKFFLSEG